MALLPLPVRCSIRPLILLLTLLPWPGLVLAHNGEPAPMNVHLKHTGAPRWSWLHWWEANRERFFVAPEQDDALQPEAAEQLDALRAEAAGELLKAIEQNARDSLTSEAALALGKLRHEPALPLLKRLAAKGDTVRVRRAALIAIGLIGSDPAEAELGQFSSTRVGERVAALAGIGLLPDLQAATLRRLRSTVTADGSAKSIDKLAPAAVMTWALRHHQKDDNLEYFRGLLGTSESYQVASEALLGLGGTKDHAAQRLLEEVLFGLGATQVRAYEQLEEMNRRKRGFTGRDALRDTRRRLNPQQPAPRREEMDITFDMSEELLPMGYLRSSAAIAMGELNVPRAGESLLSFLREDPVEDPFLVTPMSFAIMSLTAYPTEASRDRLIAILGKQDERGKLVLDVTRDSPLRGFAALALGLYARPYETPQGPADRVKYDWAITTLTERLEDERENEEVRTACAVALGLTQRGSVLPILQRLSAKLEQRSRRNDFPVLGFVLLGRALAGEKNLIEPARRALLDRPDDPSPAGILSRRAAVLALGVTRSATAVPVLTKAWHLNHYVNKEVILALRLVGGTSAAAPVMERLRQAKDQEERAYMAQALGELLAVERPTPLSRLTVGSNYTVRNEHFLPIQSLANGFLFDYLIASFGEEW
ncbi:MAG TPA: HEAT repeat domain-containing protein [Tepidisphaeraceae bacterium]|nr:HEAT repeat domain-containing protein [Tepidisphaeraceae bacterium]